ncbi:MAG: DUF4129 domain-containing protein [Gemmatimonadetes bacterium]|nr:DUF4129 domain-containing protein [Gemmatimonadota bacterium]
MPPTQTPASGPLPVPEPAAAAQEPVSAEAPGAIGQLPGADEVGDTLREILAGPEFATYVEPESNPLLSRLVDFVVETIGDLVRWVRSFLSDEGAGLLEVLGVLIPLLALAAMGVLIVRHRRVVTAGANEAGVPEEQLPATATEWLALAGKQAGDGSFRAAATALYQGFLLTLDGRGTLAFHPSKTPGDYAGEIARNPVADSDRGVGRRFLNSFQGFSFGQESPTGEGYEELAALARQAGCSEDEADAESESP